MKSTVLCVFVKGHVPFTPEYVIRLHSMVSRTLPDSDFLCLTDRPEILPPVIPTHRIASPKGVFGWWSKIELFNPRLPLKGRLVYFDLDILLLKDLQQVVDYPAPFALAPDGGTFQPKTVHKVVKRFNSSVMVWNAGEQDRLYTEWSRTVAGRLWGDQDWIGEQAPDAAAMPRGWFPRLSEIKRPPWPVEAKVVLCKKPKNAEAAAKWSWFNEEWQ